MEPVHKALKAQFGSVDKGIAREMGLFFGSDHGTQNESNDFQIGLKFRKLVNSPAFVRSVDCDGVIE